VIPAPQVLSVPLVPSAPTQNPQDDEDYLDDDEILNHLQGNQPKFYQAEYYMEYFNVSTFGVL